MRQQLNWSKDMHHSQRLFQGKGFREGGKEVHLSSLCKDYTRIYILCGCKNRGYVHAAPQTRWSKKVVSAGVSSTQLGAGVYCCCITSWGTEPDSVSMRTDANEQSHYSNCESISNWNLPKLWLRATLFFCMSSVLTRNQCNVDTFLISVKQLRPGSCIVELTLLV